MYFSLYCKGSKRFTQCFTVRGSWRPNRNCNILTPLLWTSALCLSRSPRLLNRRPSGPFCWVMDFFTASYQQLLWTPTQSGAPSPFYLVWLSLPHLVYNSVRSLTATVWLLSWLSYIIVQRPLNRLLDLWNRMLDRHQSGNNWHAVHRSLSSGASVYECTMANFLPRHISSANFLS